jgi:ring-1,2-phenylacetyl-CoA epoxidase subunit PaaC
MPAAGVAALIGLADDHLILGHRLSEWCGHAPMLEEDLAMPNIALDLIGQSRAFTAMRAIWKGQGAMRMLWPLAEWSAPIEIS